jgi:uncharacterized DUF497 family protein
MDDQRVILADLHHSGIESWYFCLGKVHGAVLTVRFTYRDEVIRIFGAAYWPVSYTHLTLPTIYSV